MFPGQGSQFPGMGKDYFDNFNEAKLAFEEASDATGLHLKKLCFEGSEEELKSTDVTQPALLTTSTAIYRSVESTGIFEGKELLFAGHSLGEYSALVAMKAVALGVAAKLVNHRGRYMQKAVPAGVGSMSAFIFKPGTDGPTNAQKICEKASRLSGSFVSVANYNSAEQIVISGEVEAVDAAQKIGLEDSEFSLRKAVPLAVSAPFHCALMKHAAEKLSPELKAIAWRTVGASYIANVDAEVHTVSAQETALLLEKQITASVLWYQSVQKALSLGFEKSYEVGAGAVLSGLAKRIQFQERSLTSESLENWEKVKNGLAN